MLPFWKEKEVHLDLSKWKETRKYYRGRDNCGWSSVYVYDLWEPFLLLGVACVIQQE
jgi:hypothetical protein